MLPGRQLYRVTNRASYLKYIDSLYGLLQAEVRCHAVLCKSELIAQTITSQLQERLTVALDEFMREKRRSQHSRLALTQHHHQSSLPNDILNHAGGSVRTKFLKLGQNFRPPIGHSNSAPKLGSITEGDEDDELGADSAADDLMSSSWQSGSEHDCDADTDSVFTSSPHTKYVLLLLLLLQLYYYYYIHGIGQI